MVYYEHDILDEIYTPAVLDRFRVYYENVEITTVNTTYKGDTCCLHTKEELYGVTLTNGDEITIPVADVISFKGIKCGAWYKMNNPHLIPKLYAAKYYRMALNPDKSPERYNRMVAIETKLLAEIDRNVDFTSIP